MKLLKFSVGACALFVAACAAFFSVKGIASLFAGAFIGALVMAISLEVSKLIATSYLYRRWKVINGMLKAYLTSAVLILMFITSLGIFGFLTSAYQDSALKYEIQQTKIENIESQKQLIIDDIETTRERIQTLTTARQSQESRLDEITGMIGTTITARTGQDLQTSTQELIAQSSADISKAQDKLDTLSDKRIKLEEDILALKTDNEQTKDIQTFQFVAKELNMELDKVAKWFILIIIAVFDPLAVALVLAYNTFTKRDDSETDEDPPTNTSRKKHVEDESDETVYISVPPIQQKKNVSMRELYDDGLKPMVVSESADVPESFPEPEFIKEEPKVEEPLDPDILQVPSNMIPTKEIIKVAENRRLPNSNVLATRIINTVKTDDGGIYDKDGKKLADSDTK